MTQQPLFLQVRNQVGLVLTASHLDLPRKVCQFWSHDASRPQQVKLRNKRLVDLAGDQHDEHHPMQWFLARAKLVKKVLNEGIESDGIHPHSHNPMLITYPHTT